ncbi:MAG: response regulator [Rhodospirillales bacterium]|nr:response regulator [Rhodospirillales bacterium]
MTLLFPASSAESSTDKPAAEYKGTQACSGGTETILVVEDERLILKYVVRTLGELGYNLITAKDGDRAKEYLENGLKIDCLFSDIVMPGTVNGRDLADWVSANQPHVQILLTSGYSSDLESDINGGEQRYPILRKPYTPDQMAQEIRSVIDSRDSR